MGIFDKLKSIFTGGNDKVIDMDTLNPESFKFIASDAIESFNKESNCYLEIKKGRKRKVEAVDKKYEGYGKFLLTLEDSNVEVAFKSKKMIFNGFAKERMLSDLNDALQYCDAYATSMDYFVVRKITYVDVNDVEASKNEMKESLKALLEDVKTIIKQSLPWPRTTEYDDEDDEDKKIQRNTYFPSSSYTSSSSSSSSRSSSSKSGGTTKSYSSSSSPKNKTEDFRKKAIKDEIESYKRQKEECDRQIKHYQEQNKGIKDKHTKEVNKGHIDHWRKNKENLNKQIERAKERLKNF